MNNLGPTNDAISVLRTLMSRKYPSWLPIATIVVGSAGFTYLLRSSGLAADPSGYLGLVAGLSIGALVDGAITQMRVKAIAAVLLSKAPE